MKTGMLKGVLLVITGAVCYAVLATLVRLAYNEGYTTTEVIVAQYTLGLLASAVSIGMPKTGIGLGSIIISIEIPVSVSMAYILLHEQVLAIQWLGIVLILTAIVLINLNTLRKEFKTV